MNKSVIATTIGVFVALSNIGCNQVQQPQPAPNASVGIAVIDLDEIAKQLGSDKQIVTAIKQREVALNNKLGEIAKAYSAQFEKQKQAIEAEPQEGAEGGVQLATYQKQVNQSFNNAKAKAQQNLTQHREQLVQQFRSAVLPAARKVAKKRGLSVIVTRHDRLLYDFPPESDITNEVVTLLRTANAQKPAPAATSQKAATPGE